jgi:hypothetical protein
MRTASRDFHTIFEFMFTGQRTLSGRILIARLSIVVNKPLALVVASDTVSFHRPSCHFGLGEPFDMKSSPLKRFPVQIPDSLIELRCAGQLDMCKAG